MKIKQLFFLAWSICPFYAAWSQNTLDINNVKAIINHEGSFFKNLATETSGFEVPKGSHKSTIYTSALWIGGFDATNNLYEAAQTYRQNGTDFWAGPLDTNNLATDTTGWQKTWKVNRSTIEYHKSNWNKGGYVISNEILNWPGNGTGAKSKILAPFADLNSNQIYEPLHGEYPLIYGDQAVYFIMNDTFSRHTETGGKPLGIEIKGMAYAFNPSRFGDSLNNTIFLHLDIKNFSNRIYKNVYAGIWTDFDIGFAYDDYIGCDTIHNLYYGYNGDSLDEGITGYGLNTPVQAVKFLNHKMTHFMKYNNDFSHTGNPFESIHYYNFMDGKWKNGQHIRFGGDGYNNIWENTATNYMYPGDPRLDNPTWNEITAGNTPGDRRGLASAGPFNVNPKDKLSLDIAYIFVKTTNPDLFYSFSELFELSDKVQQLYNQGKLNGPDFTAINNEIKSIKISVYPNPMGSSTTISFSNPEHKPFNLKITDMSGKIVSAQYHLKTDQIIVTKDQLQAGFYLISLENEGQYGRVKLIVK